VANEGQVWTLHDADGAVATITTAQTDFPWLEAKFLEQPGFEGYRSLFDLKLAATEREDWAEAEKLYLAIRAKLRLTDPVGIDVPEFLLHVRGEEAWFRFSYEPFDDGEPAQ
jgi:hypothetical protein